MPRLIDGSELYKYFSTTNDGQRMPEVDCDNLPIQVDIADVKKAIRDAPTVDAVSMPSRRVKQLLRWITAYTI